MIHTPARAEKSHRRAVPCVEQDRAVVVAVRAVRLLAGHIAAVSCRASKFCAPLSLHAQASWLDQRRVITMNMRMFRGGIGAGALMGETAPNRISNGTSSDGYSASPSLLSNSSSETGNVNPCCAIG